MHPVARWFCLGYLMQDKKLSFWELANKCKNVGVLKCKIESAFQNLCKWKYFKDRSISFAVVFVWLFLVYRKALFWAHNCFHVFANCYKNKYAINWRKLSKIKQLLLEYRRGLLWAHYCSRFLTVLQIISLEIVFSTYDTNKNNCFCRSFFN